MDFETLNHRLGATEYISHPADVQYYDRLVAEVHRIARPSDRFELPVYQEPHAWSRAYALYLKFDRRSALPSDVKQAEDDRAFAEIEKSWNDYIGYRHQIMWSARVGLANKDTLAYLGLEPEDLDPPTLKDGSRAPDWMDRCWRLEHAVTALQNLTREQKAAIPQIMAARRAEAAAAALNERVARLEGQAHG